MAAVVAAAEGEAGVVGEAVGEAWAAPHHKEVTPWLIGSGLGVELVEPQGDDFLVEVGIAAAARFPTCDGAIELRNPWLEEKPGQVRDHDHEKADEDAPTRFLAHASGPSALRSPLARAR